MIHIFFSICLVYLQPAVCTVLLITFSVSQDIRKVGVYHVEEFSGFYLTLCELQ